MNVISGRGAHEKAPNYARQRRRLASGTLLAGAPLCAAGVCGIGGYQALGSRGALLTATAKQVRHCISCL